MQQPPMGNRSLGAKTEGASAWLVRHGDPLGRYAVRRLSASGVSVLGPRALERGRLVRVLLELPNGPGPVACWGAVERVAKRGRGGVGMELRFPHLSPETEDLLQDAVVEALGRRRSHGARSAVVFDPRPDARSRLEAAARVVGCRVVVAAATPLEALMAVRAEEEHAPVLLVDGAGLDASAMEAVELLADRPGVAIVGIDAWDLREGLRARLARVARCLLPEDFDEAALETALRA